MVEPISTSNICDLCRLCTQRVSDLERIEIYKDSGKQENIEEKIKLCLPIQLEETDSLPKIVCIPCCETVKQFSTFRQLTLNSERLLNEALIISQEKGVTESKEQVHETIHVFENAASSTNQDLQPESPVINPKNEDEIEIPEDVIEPPNEEPEKAQSPVFVISNSRNLLKPSDEDKDEISNQAETSGVSEPTPYAFHISAAQYKTILACQSPARRLITYVPGQIPQNSSKAMLSILKKSKQSDQSENSNINVEIVQQVNPSSSSEPILLKINSIPDSPKIKHFKIDAIPDTGKLTLQKSSEIFLNKFLEQYESRLAVKKGLGTSLVHLKAPSKKAVSITELKNQPASSVSLISKQPSTSSALSTKNSVFKKQTSAPSAGRSSVLKNLTVPSSLLPGKSSTLKSLTSLSTGKSSILKLNVTSNPVSSLAEKLQRRRDSSFPITTGHENSQDVVAKMNSYKYQCPYCKASFLRADLAFTHIKNDHLVEHNQEVTSKRKEIAKRQREMRRLKLKNGIQCATCNKRFCSKFRLNQHMRIHTGETPFECKYCQRKFKHASSLNGHVRLHEKRWLFVCDFCGQGFVQKNHFKQHVFVHTGERPFMCQHCGKGFTCKGALMSHEKSLHPTNDVRESFLCRYCSRPYLTKNSLRIHEKKHGSTVPVKGMLQCEICGKKIPSKRGMRKHVSEDHGLNNVECHVCKKVLNSKRGLKAHLLTHSISKPYACEHCGKAFAVEYSMKCHVRLHTGERPYSCEVCGQAFNQRSALRNHQKLHVVFNNDDRLMDLG